MSQKSYIIGIDIGGTNIKAVLWNGEKIIMNNSLATPKDTLEHLLIMINALVEPLQERAEEDKIKISGAGLSVAGVHDFKNGIVILSPNIPILNGVPLKKLLSDKFKIPIKMDNDANCFIRAEAKEGAASNYQNAYGIIISTGIGGGWWFNNQVYQGEYGGAGEPGGMIMDFSNPISAEKIYQKLNQNNPLNLAAEAYRGDDLAKKAYDEIGELLGMVCANIINIIDPEIIVIGGGTTKSSDLFFSQAKKTALKYAQNIPSRKIKIVKGKLENDAGAIGAAMLFD